MINSIIINKIKKKTEILDYAKKNTSQRNSYILFCEHDNHEHGSRRQGTSFSATKFIW